MDFRIYIPLDGGHVGCGIWQRLASQNHNYWNCITRASAEESTTIRCGGMVPTGLLLLVVVLLLPTGEGGLFGPCHQTGSQNSRILSPRISKISDFSFMLFGHIVAKFQVN